MKKTFNLKSFLEKKANYEGVQGYMVAETRAWQNCVRCKQAAGKGAQEAWEKCLEEYQKMQGSLDWIKTNCHKDEYETIEKTAQSLQMGPYWDRLSKYRSLGMTAGEAVSKALKDCEGVAKNIPMDVSPVGRQRQ